MTVWQYVSIIRMNAQCLYSFKFVTGRSDLIVTDWCKPESAAAPVCVAVLAVSFCRAGIRQCAASYFSSGGNRQSAPIPCHAKFLGHDIGCRFTENSPYFLNFNCLVAQFVWAWFRHFDKATVQYCTKTAQHNKETIPFLLHITTQESCRLSKYCHRKWIFIFYRYIRWCK